MSVLHAVLYGLAIGGFVWGFKRWVDAEFRRLHREDMRRELEQRRVHFARDMRRLQAPVQMLAPAEFGVEVASSDAQTVAATPQKSR